MIKLTLKTVSYIVLLYKISSILNLYKNAGFYMSRDSFI